MRLKLFAILVLLVVAGGAVVVSMGGLTPTTSAATSLLTAAAAVADVTDEIAATGTIEADAGYSLAFGQAPVETDGAAESEGDEAGDSLAASITWSVMELAVAVGDHVTEGQVLATADTDDLEARIADAKRAEKSAALQLRQAEIDRANADTAAERRQTQTALYNAQTADANAEEDLDALEALRDHATLVAPASGIVTAIEIREGADAPSGAAITLISDSLRVVTSVVESDVAAIEAGQAATVEVAAIDAVLQGSVAAIDPVGSDSGTNGVVAFAVTVTVDAPPAGLRPGMSADITIVAASATDVLAIPSRALSGGAGSYTVRVVAADGSVSTRPVQVGLVTASLAEITSGLQAGEEVVTGTSSDQNGTTNVGGPGVFPAGGQVIRNGVGVEP